MHDQDSIEAMDAGQGVRGTDHCLPGGGELRQDLHDLRLRRGVQVPQSAAHQALHRLRPSFDQAFVRADDPQQFLQRRGRVRRSPRPHLNTRAQQQQSGTAPRGRKKTALLPLREGARGILPKRYTAKPAYHHTIERRRVKPKNRIP